MDGWITLGCGVVAVVLVEVVAYRAYTWYRARKESRFTKEGLGPVCEDLQEVRRHLLESERFLQRRAELAAKGGDAAVSCLMEALREGASSRVCFTDAFCEKLDLPPVKPLETGFDGDAATDDALGSWARAARAWAYDEIPLLVQRAQKAGHRSVAKHLRIMAEAEGRHADVAEDVVRGSFNRESEVSLCPTCGSVFLGRCPAFCTICNKPNFEMKRIKKGKLD